MPTANAAHQPQKETLVSDSQTTGGHHDRVVMASLKADGTPDQTPDFEYVGDKACTIEATKEQLATSAVAATDAQRHRDATASPETNSEPDPAVAEDIKAKEQAVAAAEKAAESVAGEASRATR